MHPTRFSDSQSDEHCSRAWRRNSLRSERYGTRCQKNHWPGSYLYLGLATTICNNNCSNKVGIPGLISSGRTVGWMFPEASSDLVLSMQNLRRPLRSRGGRRFILRVTVERRLPGGNMLNPVINTIWCNRILFSFTRGTSESPTGKFSNPYNSHRTHIYWD